MPNSTESKPKLWEILLPVIAIIISLATLAYTIVNQIDQNNRWDKLNLGHLEVVEIDFQTFNVGIQKDIDKIGIDTKYQYIFENDQPTEKLRIPFKLALWDKTKNSPLDTVKLMTVSEANSYIKNNKIDPNTVAIYRMYRILAKIKNIGNSKVENVMISIDTDLNNKVILAPSESNEEEVAGIRYTPQSAYFIDYVFYTPLDKDFPEPFIFSIKISYKDINNVPIEDTFHFRYKDFTWVPISRKKGSNLTSK